MIQMKKTCLNKQYIKQKLIEMGYSPNESNGYYRMRAIYRGGNNNSALSVNTNTGCFYDFVECKGGSFLDLIKITLGDISKEDLNRFLIESNDNTFNKDIKDRIKMEKTYDIEILEKLLPSYDFFIKKNIDELILKKYRCGFCCSGELNRRIVFPIFNKDGVIHGFTGRHISWNNESTFPKWKHKGKTSDWLYPIYVQDKDGNFPFLKEVKDKKELIIVESVGDSLTLSQNGYANNMVCFGLNISPKQLAFIAGMDLKKVIIATNNDKNKEENRGAISAIKIYIKLISEYIDSDKLFISLPTLNDFSDMQSELQNFDEWYKNKVINFKKEESLKYILKTLQKHKNLENSIFTKKDLSKIPVIESLCL